MVTVVGKVRAIDPLIAPLAGTHCVAYRTLIKLRPEAITDDALVYTSESLAPFDLLTEDGVVRVEGPGFELVRYEPVPIIPRPLQRQRDRSRHTTSSTS